MTVRAVRKTIKASSLPTPKETVFQKSLVKQIRRRLRKGVSWFAVANERNCGVRRGAALKAQGVRAGAPDMMFFRDGQAFALELKRLKPRGTVKPAQDAMHAELRAAGVTVAVCWGLDEALAQLEAWSILAPNLAIVTVEPAKQTGPEAE